MVKVDAYRELEGKEVKRIGGNYEEDVSIGDGKTHKVELRKEAIII